MEGRWKIKKKGKLILSDWVDSIKDRDYWRVLVNAALNFWVP